MRLEEKLRTPRLIRIFCFFSIAFASLCLHAIDNVADGNAAGTSAPSDGYLIISLGSLNPGIVERLYLRLRETSSRKTHDVLFTPQSRGNDQLHDFSNGKISASVYVLRLPPGQYEFYSFASKSQVLSSAGLGQKDSGLTPSIASLGPKQEFSVPFAIERGKATYVAQFMHNVFYARGTNPLRNPGFSYFVVSNQQGRDVDTARKRGDISRDVPVISAIPDLMAINSPAIRGAPVNDADPARR
jgi:hypothetical protein